MLLRELHRACEVALVAQHREDLRHERRLARESWERRGYTSHDVLHRAITILEDADQALLRERIRASL